MTIVYNVNTFVTSHGNVDTSYCRVRARIRVSAKMGLGLSPV